MLAAAREVRAALDGEKLAGLVNNAGMSVAGPVLGLSADKFRQQMEVNVIGPVIATQAFGPLLGADPSLKGPPGRIVMISSVAGKSGNPFTAAYAASKHAIEGLSESLRRELMLFGIDVIIVAPGPVKTPIWSKGREDADISRYQNSPYLPALQKVTAYIQQLEAIGLPPEKIAEVIHDALTLPNPEGALSHRAGHDAACAGGRAAQAHDGPDDRQAPRPAAAGAERSRRLRRPRRRFRGHADHAQHEHGEQRNQEQRVERHVGDALAKTHRELEQQIVAADEVQRTPGARAERGCGTIERGRGHRDDEGIADAAEDVGRH